MPLFIFLFKNPIDPPKNLQDWLGHINIHPAILTNNSLKP